MKALLAKKLHMTQVFTEDGKVHSATVLSVTPNVVTQVKSQEKDGYNALQLGFGVRKEKRVAQAQKGAWKDLGMFSHVREFRTEGNNGLEKGAIIAVDIFSPGDVVAVTATSKGKGFQGVVKRHGFKGGPRSHGQKHSEREPGSIGGGLRAKVPKGMRMAGRMGGDTVTVKNLTVLQVVPDQNLLVVEGAVPGRRGTLVKVSA